MAYHVECNGVNSAPISGNYLARNHLSLVCKAFVGADLKLGFKRPVDLTMVQAAWLAKVNPTYVGWAVKRYNERPEIEAGLIPLVYAPTPKVSNGLPVWTGDLGVLPAIACSDESDDAKLLEIVRYFGPARVLDAACAAEASQ